MIPATVLLTVGFAIGVDWPGFGGLVLAIFCVMATGTIAACWGVSLALRYRTQSAAPLMQAGMFVLVLFTTAYAPLELLQGWLADIARINPLTQVVDAARLGFIGAADHLGGHLAGAAGARRPAGGADVTSPCAACGARATECRSCADLCRGVLEASHAEGERRGVRYSYTRPSPTRYPWQWYWDSCFAAIVWRRFDPQRPRDELTSLLNAMRPTASSAT